MSSSIVHSVAVVRVVWEPRLGQSFRPSWSAALGVLPDQENTLEKLSLSWWTGMRNLVGYARLLPDFSQCD
jgi:hypothetical protein